MSNSIENLNVIVTGATRGIGYSIAARLLQEGARVAICGRTEESTKKAVMELARTPNSDVSGRVVGKAADVAKANDVSDFFNFVDGELGPPDVLVNNAGIGKFASTAALSIDDWRSVLETNLSGVFYCSHEALPRFKKRGGGYIINISSLAGRNPFAGGAAYNASKFGLNGLSEAMMLDHRQDNVRVSYIMPGSVATDFGSVSDAHAAWKIAPEDIADIVVMLLNMPSRTLVSRVEVRPSKPAK